MDLKGSSCGGFDENYFCEKHFQLEQIDLAYKNDWSMRVIFKECSQVKKGLSLRTIAVLPGGNQVQDDA